MNKFTKGAIATGAGIVLLLGGAGTFALWSDTENVAGGTVTAGTLSIDTPGTATWMDISPDRSSVSISPSTTFKAVPGDVIKFSQNFVVHATGKNLVADISVNTGSITTGAWAANVTPTIVTKVNNVAATQITSNDDGKTLTVEVTLSFAASAGNITQSAVVDLTSLVVTASQVARP